MKHLENGLAHRKESVLTMALTAASHFDRGKHKML